MNKPSAVGIFVRKLREERGLSALAVSQKAGLGPNYIRQLERAGRYPDPHKLMAVAEALELDEQNRAVLRRLAGIDPDPSSTPEAKKLRREAWLPLAYIYVNGFMLPRLELQAELTRRDRANGRDADLLRAAAASPDIVSFVTENQSKPSPSRRLVNRLEETFRDAPPVDVEHLQQQIDRAAEMRALGDPYRWHERWATARVLRAYNRPLVSDYDLERFIHTCTFDYHFAVSVFPALYWHASRVWPFEKVFMPFARRDAETQRRLYDAIQAELSLEDFARALLGLGELGESLHRSEPARPFQGDIGHGWVKLAFRTRGRTVWPEGKPPPIDAVFDGWDRLEFLDRFPLLKVDRESFARLGRSLDSPYWTAWTDYIRLRANTPPGRVSSIYREEDPPLSPDRFETVISYLNRRDSKDDAPDTLDSYVARAIVDRLSDAAARCVGRQEWSRVATASEHLGVDADWLQIIGALSDAPR